ncbi:MULTISPECIES: pyruvoyl-dependent arginine decarboxylase [Thermococcus]|uniref:Pyruvoyl-dependent arginine decarboxylase n=1 Tax=Thermococcus sibiricus TaxID=172049 RepID=A0A101EKJ5_9EURY|nr:MULTISPECIES: arginine decarboxylase, pyruvoyl-dependent [Thermococcus]KUK17077.1 MAG: Pyruvoyl-dependent arginine decarboxylase [Thermococcus sibiricus]KUK28097.1 MAG: Pyruvoyl-dependent arginine decarboxylase [Thermococcus sp. 40_45]MBC7095121.1 arginine decarboxylase, pyruvoyl-dependent [Thermococcus sp.]HII67759.1 arginine decarboxylase, pyruvoyl-dependent [Thermococcaceae archaeon]
MSWTTPKKAILLAASAEGGTKLNAFDNALLKMGIGNVNLVKLSSVIPAYIEWIDELPKNIPVGMLLPTVYAHIESDEPGSTITAALGVGISEGNEGGLIYEYSGYCTKEEAEKMVHKMVEEGFKVRGWKLKEFKAAVAEITVKDRPVAAIAAVVMLPY